MVVRLNSWFQSRRKWRDLCFLVQSGWILFSHISIYAKSVYIRATNCITCRDDQNVKSNFKWEREREYGEMLLGLCQICLVVQKLAFRRVQTWKVKTIWAPVSWVLFLGNWIVMLIWIAFCLLMDPFLPVGG